MAFTNDQIDFINFCEQWWFTHGQLPTKDAVESMGLPANSWWKYFGDADFRDSLLTRGISLKGLAGTGPNEPRSQILTEEQLVVANTLLDMRDNRSQKKKLEQLGISTQKYQGWLRDPAYQNYIRTRGENALGDNQHEAHLALVERVRVGDISAIKYFNEITGRYVPSKDSNINISQILMMVIETIQRHVTDPDTQEAIAEDLLRLIQIGRMEEALTVNRYSSQSNNPVGAFKSIVGEAVI